MNKRDEKEYDLVFGINKIMNMMPHRYPFLLIDEVRTVNGELAGVGKKNVTINEPYFTGHFPGEPLVPGALIIESIAQTIAIVYGSKYIEEGETADISGHVGYLVSANVKFMNKVVPGDTMSIFVECVNHFNKFSSYDAVVYAGNKIAAKGSVQVSER